FSANAFRLQIAGSMHSARDINLAGVKLAREGAKGAVLLGAIGPCGKALMPLGSIDIDDARDAFTEQAQALLDGGVDGFMMETFADLGELRLAIEAVRSISDLPIVACKSFIEDGETLAEGFPLRAAKEMAGMGA